MGIDGTMDTFGYILSLCNMVKNMLYGFDIGGTKIAFSAFESDTSVLTKPVLTKPVLTKRVPTPASDYASFQAAIVKLVSEADQALSCRGRVGIGIPGFINPATGLSHCANIPCANHKPLQLDIEAALDRKVVIENDANCFVLSEAVGGAGEGVDAVWGVILGTGCGGGLSIGQQLYTGRNHSAGEWGHTPLPYSIFEWAGTDFPIVECGCGLRGCLDNYLSGRGLELIYKHQTRRTHSGAEIIQQYRSGDANARKSVTLYMELLASGLSGIINTLDPGVIVLGGGVSNVDEVYTQVPPLLKKYTIKTGTLPAIRKAVFGDAGGVRGAAMLNRHKQ